MRIKGLPISYHINNNCNMDCTYCFAKFGNERTLTMQESFTLIDEISKAGFRKISFAGGEPTLCEWLFDIIKHSKKCGLITMVVTNGTGITDSFLKDMRDYLDWIGLSVDSLSLDTIKAIGKQIGNDVINEDYYIKKVDKINSYGYKLKINTVISAVNAHEDLSYFINYAKPLRWKLFQMLPIKCNEIKNVESFLVSNADTITFYKRHLERISKKTQIVLEDNDTMTNSYIMIDPAGRFFDNTNFEYHCSQSILDVGIEKAFNEIQLPIDIEKMRKRNAIYDWD